MINCNKKYRYKHTLRTITIVRKIWVHSLVVNQRIALLQVSCTNGHSTGESVLLQVRTLPPPSGLLHQRPQHGRVCPPSGTHASPSFRPPAPTATARASLSSFRYTRFPLLQASCTNGHSTGESVLLQVRTLPPPSGLLHQRPQHGRVCPPSGTHASPSFRPPAPTATARASLSSFRYARFPLLQASCTNGHSTGESVLLQVRTLPPPSGLLHQRPQHGRVCPPSGTHASPPSGLLHQRPQHGRVCPPSGTHASPSFRPPAPNGHSTGESVLLQVRTLPPPSGLLHQRPQHGRVCPPSGTHASPSFRPPAPTATARASLSSFRYARFPLLQASCTNGHSTGESVLLQVRTLPPPSGLLHQWPQHGRVCPPSGTHASPSFRSPAPNGHSTGESVLLQVRTLPPPSGLLHQTATARASLSSFRYARFPLLQASCTNGHSTGESVLLQVRTLPPPSGLLHQWPQHGRVCPPSGTHASPSFRPPAPMATARASLSSFRYARFPLLQASCTNGHSTGESVLLQVHTLPPPSGLLHQRPQHGRVCPPSGTHASPSFRPPAPNGHSTGESVLLQVRTLPPPSGLLHQRPQHGRVCPPSGTHASPSFRPPAPNGHSTGESVLLQVRTLPPFSGTHASPSFRPPAPNGHSTGESVLLQVRTLPPPSGLLHQTATARASLSSWKNLP